MLLLIGQKYYADNKPNLGGGFSSHPVCVFVCVLPFDFGDYKISLFIRVFTFQWTEWNVKGKKYEDFDIKMWSCKVIAVLRSFIVLCHLELLMKTETLR